MYNIKEFRVLVYTAAFFLCFFCWPLENIAENTRNLSVNVKDVRLSTSEANAPEQASNKAASINIIKSTLEQEILGKQAPTGRIFLVLETQWENIHPKQKVEKSKLEGKTDKTMGVSTFAGKKKKTEYVEVDVAYMIEKLYNHAYILADGLAFSLHGSTEDIPEGVNPQEAFTIPKKGDVRKVNFVYLIPKSSENFGFQFFDYEYGHILLSIQGDIKKARGTGGPPGKVLSLAKSDLVEFAALSFDIQNEYAEEEAPEGWHYVVVQLSGKSLSGKSVKDIVQIKPKEYTWVTTDGGYFYYSSGGSTTEQGFIRFTPEIYQHQELAFLVPKSACVNQLGVRIRNDVFQLDLTGKKPKGMPKAIATHRDGDIMEVMIFGMRKDNGKVLLDLGIQSMAASGIEIQRKAQFILIVNEEKISIDDTETNTLLHRPPSPFIIPPKTFIRFELAYETEASPTSLYFRGYRSEATLNLSDEGD